MVRGDDRSSLLSRSIEGLVGGLFKRLSHGQTRLGLEIPRDPLLCSLVDREFGLFGSLDNALHRLSRRDHVPDSNAEALTMGKKKFREFSG